MKQEDKELLLKDLSARLPYGVIINVEDKYPATVLPYFNLNLHPFTDFLNRVWSADKLVTKVINEHYDYLIFRPFLRPMSSMTEEEREEFSVFIGKTEMYVQQVRLDADSMTNPIIGGFQCVYWGLFDKCIDWLNKKMFDYRGLIPMGLALEAPEGMYQIV